MKNLMLFTLLLLITGAAHAQPMVEWSTVAVDTYDEHLYGCVDHVDNGVIAVGNSVELPGFNFRGVFTRFADDGTLLWQNQYEQVDFYFDFRDVCAVHGSTTEFLAVGYATDLNAGESDFFLLHFDDAGNVLSTASWDEGTNDQAYSIEQVPAGGYIVGGYSDISGYLFYLDNALNQQWTSAIAPTGVTSNSLNQVRPLSCGGFICAGSAFDGTYAQQWVVRTDPYGHPMWTWINSTTNVGFAEDVIETAYGDYVVTGAEYNSGVTNYDTWTARISEAGSLVWETIDGGIAQQDFNTWIMPGPGSGYYIGGYAQNAGAGDYDQHLQQFNETGTIVNSWFISEAGDQLIFDACMVDNGEYIAVGDQDETDSYAVKLTLPAATFSVFVDPAAPPVVIPPGGGSFAFDVGGTNTSGTPFLTDAWIKVSHTPTMNSVETHVFTNVGIPGSGTVSTTLIQNIPAFAPPGDYVMTLHAGNYPWVIQAYDSMTFSKSFVTSAMAADPDFDPSIFDRAELWPVSGSFDGVETSVMANDTSLPSEFSLGAAYPNPFNPSTTLSVNLPETAELTVAVYNVTGQQVAELAHGSYAAGSHTLTFDASHLSGGVYFVRALSGNQHVVQKVLLLK